MEFLSQYCSYEPMLDGFSFSNGCCGSKYYKTYETTTPNQGIVIIPGDVEKEMLRDWGDKAKVEKVTFPDGDCITLLLRNKQA